MSEQARDPRADSAGGDSDSSEEFTKEELLQMIEEAHKEQKNKSYFHGVFVIGPSGSGKSTFCHALQHYYEQIKRKHVVINLDPANETMQYKTSIDIRELIELDDVMEEFQLGPNGGLLYCMEFLEKNTKWLQDRIMEYKDHYLLFDMPGQIELYMSSPALKRVIQFVQYNKAFECDLVVAALFDCHYCYSEENFISLCMQALASQINLEMPHVNILSKIDLMKHYGPPPINFENIFNPELALLFAFDDVILKRPQTKFMQRYRKLNKSISEVIDSQSLISFSPLRVEDMQLIANVSWQLDKANGYAMRNLQGANDELLLDPRNHVHAYEGVEETIERLKEEFFGDADDSDDERQVNRVKPDADSDD